MHLITNNYHKTFRGSYGWVIVDKYPNYKEFERLFDNDRPDVHEYTSTVRGIQKNLQPSDWQDLRDDYTNWISSVFDKADIEHDRFVDREKGTWTVEYQQNGYQGMHTHQLDPVHCTRFCTSVMLFDQINPTQENLGNGHFYCLLQTKSEWLEQIVVQSRPGTVLLMDDRTWHGVYPTDKTRRCFVWDFDYNEQYYHNDTNKL